MNRYIVAGPFDRDAVITYTRLTPERTGQISLYVARDHENAKRDYLLYQHTMQGPEYRDGKLVQEGDTLLLSFGENGGVVLKSGAALWVESDVPVVTAYQAGAA